MVSGPDFVEVVGSLGFVEDVSRRFPVRYPEDMYTVGHGEHDREANLARGPVRAWGGIQERCEHLAGGPRRAKGR